MHSNKEIIKITFPIFLQLIAQNVINLTDTAFLGRVSEVALGASAIAGVYFLAIYVIGIGFSQGAQILIARRNGENNFSKIGPIFNNGLLFILFIAVCFVLIGFFVNHKLMLFLVSSQQVYQATMEYLDWRMYGLIFALANTMFRAFYIGITKTRILTYAAIISTSTNVVLNYLLIFGKLGFPEMGIAGCALASVLAEAAATVYLLIVTFKNKKLKVYNLFKFLKIDFKAIYQMLDLSVFIMFQYFISITTWFMFFVFIERMGERELAATNIGRSIYMILMIPAQAISIITGTIVSNLIGAGKKNEVLSSVFRLMRMSLLFVLPFSLLALFFPELFAVIYTNEAGLIASSLPVIRIVALSIFFFGVANVLVSAISGTGNTKISFFIEVFTLLFYISYIYLTAIVYPQEVWVVWLSEFVYWSIIGILAFFYLVKGKWYTKVI